MRQKIHRQPRPPRRELAEKPGWSGSGNPKLSALRINGEPQFIAIVERALELNHGHIVNTATALKVSRNSLMRWIAFYPSLQLARDNAREKD